MDANFWISLLSVIVTVIIASICGFWAISIEITKRFKEIENKSLESFRTVFRRMDEKSEFADKTYVRKETYDENRKNLDKELDLRLTAIVQILTGKFEITEKAINRMESWIKENFTNKAKQ